MDAIHLIHKFRAREACVSVIGLGYVGLPLALAFAEAGFRVVGIDIDEERVANLNAGQSYVADVPSQCLAALVTAVEAGGRPATVGGRLSATTNYDALAGADAVIICVPTPLSKTKDPDLSYIVTAASEIARRLQPRMLIVLESTTYPGTTEEIVLPSLQNARGQTFQVGRDFFLAFSPERIDPGRRDWTVRNTPKVISGVTPRCLEVA